MSNRPTNASKQRPTLVGWLIAALICVAVVGCVWLASWCFTWVISWKGDAGLATLLTVIAVIWGLFHTKWNLSTSPSRFKGHEVDGVRRIPQRRYGPWWIALWAACFLGCIACIVIVILDEHGNVPIGVPLFSALGLLTLWFCLRLLWPRFTLHPPRIVLTDKSKGSVRGTFYQACKREIEHASVTIKVGYEVLRKFTVRDPDGDPGSKQKVSRLEFRVLAERTLKAELEGEGSEQEIVMQFNFSMSNAPKNLVIETQTAFGGLFDYRARF